jgi:uncharacterized protein
MNSEITQKIDKYSRLQQILADCNSVVIALSGGLDSSFLLYAAIQALGHDNVIAAIGISPALAKSEYEAAVAFAKHHGLSHSQIIELETDEIDNPDYSNNPPNRCYFCKAELYDKLSRLAVQRSDAVVCDGANASDVGDHRPGMQAASEQAVRSPLLEAELDKDEIRALAREFGLDIWDKPASACLASRIPYGSKVTREKLSQIEKAEEYLRSLGFRQLRVRHHGDLARIELESNDMHRIVANGLGAKIEEHFRGIGFTYTALDITGFRSGKMNRALKGENDG